MTTPAAPGAPEGTQGTQAPGAPAQPAQPNIDPQPATQAPQPPAPGVQGIGKPDKGQQPAAPESKPDDGKPETQDVSQLPDWAQKLIKEARADAAKSRTTAKQTAAEEARTALLADISKALGMNPDDEPTVEQLAAELEERNTRIAELEANQTEATFQGYIRDAAKGLSLDASMLAGWQNFRDEVESELSDEFTDDDLKAAVEKVAKTYVGRPQFAAANGAPPRSGAPMPGAPQQQPQRPRSLVEALGRAYGQGAR